MHDHNSGETETQGHLTGEGLMFIGSVRVSKDGNTVHLTSINPRSRAVCFPVSLSHRERNCADTIGTVPVPWAGHFQCQNINIFLK